MPLGLVGIFCCCCCLDLNIFFCFVFCFVIFLFFCFCPSWSEKETVEGFTTTETEREGLQFLRGGCSIRATVPVNLKSQPPQLLEPRHKLDLE